MLNAQEIVKSFGDLTVLKGVSLEINKKEVVSIVGSSGAGKTSLLQILGTLDKPNSGKLLINDINPFTLGRKELARFRNTQIGFIFQFHQLLPEFNALENVCMPGFIGKRNKSEVKKEATRLLDFLGLSHRIKHKPAHLSGGEQQRVAVARSLINNPPIIFADEPSGNLDSENSQELHNLFFQLRDELDKSFVIVTHNQKLADLSDRKIQLKDGAIVE